MVRVICVHHFTRQDVAPLEDAGDCHGCCPGPDDWLLVAGDHRVNIRDLGHEAVHAGGFPTVDMVQQLVYCLPGDFVVTLETKPARPGFSDHTYVRVYLNWDKQASPRPSTVHKQDDIQHSNDVSDGNSGGVPQGRSSVQTFPVDAACPPMRARIAGRVTPSGQAASSDSLEMVEIPLKKPASFVNVCQATCNIIVVSGMSLSIFKFDKKVLDAPRLEYIDFDEIFEIIVPFNVREAAILEDIVGCVSDREAHVFQVVTNQAYRGKSKRRKSDSNNIKNITVLKENGTWTSSCSLADKNKAAFDTNRRSSNSRSNSRSHSRSKSRSRSISRSPARFPPTNDKTRLKKTKEDAGGVVCSSPRVVRLADNYLDLGTAQWSDMMPYGSPPVQGALQQTLPGGHILLLLRSLLNSSSPVTGSANTTGTAAVSKDTTHEECVGPANSNHVSGVRVASLSGSGQRLITGAFHAVTLIHRRVDVPYHPAACSTGSDSTSSSSSTHSGVDGACGGFMPPYPLSSGIWNNGGTTQQLNSHMPFSNIKLLPLAKAACKDTRPGRPSHPLLLAPRRGLRGLQQGVPPERSGVEVFFSSPMSGYLYHVTLDEDPFLTQVQSGGVFGYTSPLVCAVLEQSLLHALTLTGLETYTLPPHPCVLTTVLPQGVRVKVSGLWSGTPGGSSGGIGGCLVGLRPFLNVHSLALTDSCLALIASAENTPRCHYNKFTVREDTVYSLHRPSASSLYGEMLRVGRTHYSTSPSTYLHLLLEALMVVVTRQYYRLQEQGLREDRMGAEKSAELPSEIGAGSTALGGSGGGIEECMRLKMAGKRLEEMESDISVLDSSRNSSNSNSLSSIENENKVTSEGSMRKPKERNSSVERRKRKQENKKSTERNKYPPFKKDSERQQEEEEQQDMEALIKESALLLADYYAGHSTELEWQWSLVEVYRGFGVSAATAATRLCGLREDTTDAVVYVVMNLLTCPQAPALTATQATTVLECLEKAAPDRVSELLLRSHCLPRDYKKDKVLCALKRELSQHGQPRPVDVLALAALIVDRGTADQVSTVLGLLRHHQLLSILLQYHTLLVRPVEEDSTGSGSTGNSGSGNSSITSGTGFVSPSSSAASTPRASSDVVLTPLALVLLDHKWDVFCEVFLCLIGDSTTPHSTLTLDTFCLALMDARPIVTCGPECNVNSLKLRDFLETYFMEYAYTITQWCENNNSTTSQPRSYERSVSVLVSLYLASLLGAFPAKSREEVVKEEQRQCIEEVYGPRPAYLNLMPPFAGAEGEHQQDSGVHGRESSKNGHCANRGQESLNRHLASSDTKAATQSSTSSAIEASLVSPTRSMKSTTSSSSSASGASGQGNKKLCVDLLILQSLLSSPLPSATDRHNVARFVTANPSVGGSEGVMAACLTGHKQLQWLIERRPGAVLVYGQGVCTSTADWRALVAQLHRQCATDAALHAVLQDILWELASTLPFLEFVTVLPPGTSARAGADVKRSPEQEPDAGRRNTKEEDPHKHSRTKFNDPQSLTTSIGSRGSSTTTTTTITTTTTTVTGLPVPLPPVTKVSNSSGTLGAPGTPNAASAYSALLQHSHSMGLLHHLSGTMHAYADGVLSKPYHDLTLC